MLPREEELKAQQAVELMQEGKHAEALPLLKDAWQLSGQNSEIGLLFQRLVQVRFSNVDNVFCGHGRFSVKHLFFYMGAEAGTPEAVVAKVRHAFESPRPKLRSWAILC